MALDLAKQVRKQATQHGMMLQEIANKLGIAASNLSMMLHGNPTIGTLQKIADVIGCDVKDFFDDEKDKITCPYCGRELKVKLDKISEN